MQSKKPTIYISTYDDIKNPHYGGGGAIAVHEIAKRLLKKYEVHVVSWDYSGKKKETIDAVKYERFGLPFLNPKIAMFAYQLALPFVVMSKQFDVWLESFCPPFTTAGVPLFTKKAVIGVVHMLAAEDMERKYKLPFHIVQNAGIKTYKNIIVTSEVVKRKIKEISSSSNIKVISNGIESVIKPSLKKEKYILFLGRIEVDQKGIDLLIEAFRKFWLRNKDYTLVIAGNGDPKEIEKTKELIRNAKLSKYVTVKGRVSGKTKATLLKDATCIVIPSRFETYSLVALEAMSYGAPIVSFAIEGLAWIPDNIAIKIPPYNVANLEKALSTVVTNKQLSHTMIGEGNSYAKHYTWDAVASLYEEYIKNILISEKSEAGNSEVR